MSIEQSIFTCCRARRETGTTGFGYFSATEGMDELRRSDLALSMLSNNYSAPRNQELWWSDEQDEKLRDEKEAEAIRTHHPIAFSYRVLEINGTKKAVFTYGKNIGRDIQGYRPGNILVNTIVCELDDIEAYPFEYYGSPDIFTDYDRAFFVDQPDTPADMLKYKSRLAAGGKLTREDAAEFIMADEGRVEMLLSMIQFVLDQGDSDRTHRQVMICDRMENIIYWAAAVSSVFPFEIAKQFSFTTYSFLGNADSSAVTLDDVMLCGVYSAAVNGDEPDPRATNYDYDLEAEREETALFDFEKDFFTTADLRNSGFMMLVRSAMLGSFEQLDEFHRFIMEKTDCRTIGNDYARGCGCFLIAKMRRQQTLSYLAEAQDFAEKFMGADAVRALLGIAYSCTLDNNEMSRYFDDIIAMSKSCAKNSDEDKAFVYEHCLRFLREAFLTQSLSREEYFDAKNSIKEIFEQQGDSFEQAFIGSLDNSVLNETINGIEKKWMLLDLAEMLCRDAAYAKRDLYSRDCVSMLTAVYRSVVYENENRKDLITVFADMFGTADDKLKFYDLLIAKADRDTAVKTDLVESLSQMMLEADSTLRKSVFGFAADRPFRHELYKTCDAKLSELEASIRCYSDMLDSSAVYKKYLPEICDKLLDLSENGNCETQTENIYHVFLFASDHDALENCGDNICIEFSNTLLNKGRWYKLTEREGDILRELVEGSRSSHFVDDAAAHNIFVMYYITRFAETVDENSIPFNIDNVGKLDIINLKDTEFADVVRETAHAFARRSIVTGSAVSVRYDLFLELHELRHPGILEEMTVLWLREILKTAPKDSRARLAAQMFAIMQVDCNVNFDKMGSELYHNKVKAADVIKWFEDRPLLKFLTDCGHTGGELERVASDLTAGYDRAKQSGGLFGNLFSRRGKKG